MLLQVVISGIALGSIYALLALSMVFIWKTTNVLNFAQGEMAMVTTCFAYTMMVSFHLPYWVAFVSALALGLILGILVDRVVRLILSTDFLAVIVLTISIYFVTHSGAALIWGHEVWPFHSPFSSEPMHLWKVAISPINCWIFGVAILLTAGLFTFLNYTTRGIQLRATCQDQIASILMGISSKKMFSMAWAIGSLVGAIAGILVAPLIHLHVFMMGDVLLKSFASAVLGGINSLPGAIVGGLVLGLVSNLFGAYIGTEYQDSLAFLIIIVVLLVKPHGIMGRPEAKRV